MADILLGDFIGSGAARRVYACKLDPTLVVKIETAAGSFQNVKEWEVWQELQYNKAINKWFAPCVAISACGTVLLQKRAEPAYRKHYPKKVPRCLGDLKYANYGMLQGKFVCFDYGTFLSSNGINPGFKKAVWWGE